MSALSIRIPDSLHKSVKQLSKDDKISINQFVASAIAEKVTALKTEEYLNQRAQSGSKEAFLKVLEKVPSVEPDEYDK